MAQHVSLGGRIVSVQLVGIRIVHRWWGRRTTAAGWRRRRSAATYNNHIAFDRDKTGGRSPSILPLRWIVRFGSRCARIESFSRKKDQACSCFGFPQCSMFCPLGRKFLLQHSVLRLEVRNAPCLFFQFCLCLVEDALAVLLCLLDGALAGFLFVLCMCFGFGDPLGGLR